MGPTQISIDGEISVRFSFSIFCIYNVYFKIDKMLINSNTHKLMLFSEPDDDDDMESCVSLASNTGKHMIYLC